jgi:septal ring factor EnvC (AmiA/AmiB activator)
MINIKYKILYIKYLILALWLLGGAVVWSQTEEKAELQKQKSALDQEIEYTNNLLQETKKSRETSMNELSILNSRIDKREALIRTITAEINWLEREIAKNNLKIDEQQEEFKTLKEEYAGMIYYAFKNRNVYDRMMFIFSSEDFNQAYRRMKYFQQYSTFRKAQAHQIKDKQQEIEDRIAGLEEQVDEKETLKQEKIDEKRRLDRNMKEKDETVQSLSSKERELKRSLNEKEKAARRLQNAIEAIIAEEIRKAAEAAKAAGTAPPEQLFALTPEQIELSSTFAANKGKLPWPTERGILSGRFGEQPHPVLKGIKIKNNGVDIMTNTGSNARAVFEGEVTRIISVPKYNNVVIIRHGEYLTVYSNLDDVMVSVGDQIAIKQRLGVIHTNSDEAKTELHFEIWKGKELLNPSQWMAKSGWQ